MNRYVPIAEHGLIGDLHTDAVVGIEGTIDWYCCPARSSSLAAVTGKGLIQQSGVGRVACGRVREALDRKSGEPCCASATSISSATR